MNDPMTIPVVAVRLTLPDGSLLERSWTLKDGPPRKPPMPSWLVNGRQAWEHPQDPVTLVGDVPEGSEDAARAWIEAL